MRKFDAGKKCFIKKSVTSKPLKVYTILSQNVKE
jgi:hypothetical protein